MRRGAIDQQRGCEPMWQSLDLHAIIVNRNRQDAPFSGHHDLPGRRIPWFLKSNEIASRESCTHDEVKCMGSSCCNDNVLWGTSEAARTSKIGSKSSPKCRIPIRRAVTGRWQTVGHHSPLCWLLVASVGPNCPVRTLM